MAGSISLRLSTRSVFAAVLLTGVSTPALAQQLADAGSVNRGPAVAPATPDEDPGASDGSEIIVVGTARADLTALQSASPVDVLTDKQLADTGAPTLSEALAQIAPSINFLGYTGIGATAGTSSPQLRGLDPSEVLVLVNGKRRHTAAQIHAKVGYGRGSQATDWNTIAFAGVQRVELLRDGASAQYGSDAIAGVVNIVLREDRSGGGISGEVGTNYSGRGGDTYLIDGWKGFALPNGGFLTIAGNYSNIGGTGPDQYPDPRPQYSASDPNRVRESTVNRYQRQVTPDFEEYNLLLNAQLPLGGGWDAYAFGTLSDRTTDKTGVRRRPLDTQTVRAIYPDGFTPYQHAESTDRALTLGIEQTGEALGRIDLSATYGRNRIDYDIFDTLNPSLGVNSPRHFYNGALVNEQTNISLEWAKDVSLLAKPLTISAGAIYTGEEYTILAGEPLSYTQGGVRVLDGPSAGQPAQGETVGYSPFRPDDAGSFNRHLWGVHAGLEQSIGPVDLALAGRYEHYSDFGGTTTGKFSARYNISPAFALRGMVSTGFRAPSIGQEHWSATTVTWSTVVPGTYWETRTVPVDHPVARALGAPALKPEKSKNLSAGFVLQPAPHVSLTVDGYLIDIDDRISLTENLQGAKIDALVAPYGLPAGSAISFFTNAFDTRSKGVDIVGKWDTDLLGGKLNLGLALNLNQTRITDVKPDPVVLAPLGLTLVGRQSRGLIEYLNPDSKVTASATYNVHGFDLAIFATRYGEYRRNHATDPKQDAIMGPQTIVDASIGYEFFQGLKLTIGARNLFDSYPDIDSLSLASAKASGGSPYSPLAPRGSTGGYYYARAAVRF